MKRYGKASFAHRLDLRDTARLAAFLDTAVAALGGMGWTTYDERG